MKRVIDNYESFLQLWEECLEKKLDQETKARIVVCESQMESFYFIFSGIRLSCKIYATTDNLSKSLQSTMMPAIKGKKFADLVVNKLRSMRNDECFDSFFEVVKKAPDPIKPVGKLTWPRKQKRQIILFCNTSLATKVLRAMLITQKQPKTISNQCIFKFLTQSSVPSMINLKRLR